MIRNEKPKIAVTMLAIKNLRTKIPITIKIIMKKYCKKKLTFNNIPIEIKKKLMKTSLKGRILPSAWLLYSVFEIIKPAKNAPKAGERPIIVVNHVIDKHMAITPIIKSSRFCRRAIWYKTQGIIHFVPIIMKNIIPTASNIKVNKVPFKLPAAPASKGVNKIIGITIIS
jgi:hypothetical protein